MAVKKWDKPERRSFDLMFMLEQRVKTTEQYTEFSRGGRGVCKAVFGSFFVVSLLLIFIKHCPACLNIKFSLV